jgi:hypothetical protein
MNRLRHNGKAFTVRAIRFAGGGSCAWHGRFSITDQNLYINFGHLPTDQSLYIIFGHWRADARPDVRHPRSDLFQDRC